MVQFLLAVRARDRRPDVRTGVHVRLRDLRGESGPEYPPAGDEAE